MLGHFTLTIDRVKLTRVHHYNTVNVRSEWENSFTNHNHSLGENIKSIEDNKEIKKLAYTEIQSSPLSSLFNESNDTPSEPQ